jgi:hypothetical protein
MFYCVAFIVIFSHRNIHLLSKCKTGRSKIDRVKLGGILKRNNCDFLDFVAGFGVEREVVCAAYRFPVVFRPRPINPNRANEGRLKWRHNSNTSGDLNKESSTNQSCRCVFSIPAAALWRALCRSAL